MLSGFDEYLVHQTPEPLAHPATGDRNFYDRYFFHGYTRDGSLFFAAALGLYPNRRVMDAAFSVVRGGLQHVVRASRLAPADRGETRVGPLSVEVETPLRRLRVRVEDPEGGLAADLRFAARTPPLEEPRFAHRAFGRPVMDSTRVTQLGAWSGRLAVEGEELAVAPDAVLGARDRSWGVRPVGEREAGAPGPPPQFFWLWAPVHFDAFCTHFGVNEDAEGRAWHAGGLRVAAAPIGGEWDGASEAIERMRAVDHRVRWRPGTRRAEEAELELRPARGEPLRVRLEPLLAFPMRGLGYLDPEWGHGVWKGELAVDRQRWAHADLPPLDPRNLHVQQLCRARCGDAEGVGVLEQLVIGPHAPSGFRELLDGAPA